MDNTYVVESPVVKNGAKVGIARVYVRTEDRAQELAGAGPNRTYRMLPMSEMPEAARKNMESCSS